MTVIGALLLAVAALIWLNQRSSSTAERFTFPEEPEPEPHPRSDEDVVQPRQDDRVTPYALSINVPPPGVPLVKVPSSNDPSVAYEVDASHVTCTCSNFAKRSHRPVSSLTRCCKHLIWVLDYGGYFDDADKWVKAVVDEGWGAPAEAWLIDLETAPAVLVTAAPGREWVNVFAHTPRKGERVQTASGRIKCFGWNVETDGWSYGQGPPGARELTPLMKKVL